MFRRSSRCKAQYRHKMQEHFRFAISDFRKLTLQSKIGNPKSKIVCVLSLTILGFSFCPIFSGMADATAGSTQQSRSEVWTMEQADILGSAPAYAGGQALESPPVKPGGTRGSEQRVNAGESYLAASALIARKAENPRLNRGVREHSSTESESSVSQAGNTAPRRSMLSGGLRVTISLLVVLALITAGVFLLKKVIPYSGLISNTKRPILVLSRIPLGHKRSICLVKIADEILVIGMTNTNMSLLSKINADDYFDESGKKIYEASEAGYRQSFRKLYCTLFRFCPDGRPSKDEVQ